MKTIKLYVATDESGYQYIYRERPERSGKIFFGISSMFLPQRPFDVKWEDEPLEIVAGVGGLMNLNVITDNCAVPKDIFAKLKELGMMPNDVRSHNVGNSDYSAHFIQPWAIWQDYNLNAWDGDIIKRVLRTKAEEGMTMEESRIMDYKKIIHDCEERIRQLQNK